MSNKYAKLYVCTESKFIGTAKMFLDKGVDVHDRDNETIYCIDDPAELSIMRSVDPSNNQLKLTKLELNEEYKTAKVYPVLESIPDTVKEEHTIKFKKSFKEECVNLYNITQQNPIIHIIFNNKVYTTDINLVSLFIFHVLLKNVKLSVDTDGYLTYSFRDTTMYDIYLKDSAGVTELHSVSSEVMNTLFKDFVNALSDTADQANKMYHRVDEYTYADISSIIVHN